MLNRNVTDTTERGLYGVFLISRDLSRVYLTLAQGVTDFVNRLGPTQGAQALVERANELRKMVPELTAAGFTLGNSIDLATDGRLPVNYQRGTVAFVEFSRNDLPSDRELEGYLEPLMAAYDRIAKEDAAEHAVDADVARRSG